MAPPRKNFSWSRTRWTTTSSSSSTPRSARCAAFLTQGTRNAEFYRSYGAPEEKLFLVPHAVDNDFFQQQHAALRPQRSELRRRLGLPEDAVLLLYAGRVAPERRLGGPLEAVRRG